jgi:PKD repeat protein
MPTLNVRANTVGTTNGTTWAATANAVDGTFGTNNATYATWTNAVSGATGYIELGFGTLISSVIPANAVIDSITVTLRQLVNNTSRITAVNFQVYDGATQIGANTTCVLATAARSDSGTYTPTRAQVVSSTFKVRVNGTHGANTQSGILSIDYVDVAINYTVPPVASFTAVPTTIDQGASVQFTDTSTNTPTSWSWNFGAGGPAASTAQNPLVTFPTPGTYSVTLQATNSAGSNTSSPTVITVNVVTQKNKIWNGTSWRSDAKIWNGTSWRADWKVWNGTSWQ